MTAVRKRKIEEITNNKRNGNTELRIMVFIIKAIVFIIFNGRHN